MNSENLDSQAKLAVFHEDGNCSVINPVLGLKPRLSDDNYVFVKQHVTQDVLS